MGVLLLRVMFICATMVLVIYGGVIKEKIITTLRCESAPPHPPAPFLCNSVLQLFLFPNVSFQKSKRSQKENQLPQKRFFWGPNAAADV